MEVTGKTRLIGLMGNPVEHTLSPVIHNGISKRMGIDSCYMAFKVTDDGVEAAVNGAYELGILGVNVTVPHKNRVMKYLADIDDAAAAIGAVNTLVRLDKEDSGKNGYKGYNTDMSGLRRQIQEDGIVLKNKTVVILGAGGAAKAVLYMCLLEGADRIYLLNRTLEKACKIAGDMAGLFSSYDIADPEHADKGKVIIPMELSGYDRIKEDNLIVFQATSIGLFPNVDDVVIEDENFYRKIAVGIDLIYNPANTRFMKLVSGAGGKAYNALKMLLYQGVIAYELWHDIEVPADVIDEAYIELKRKVYKRDNIVLIGFMGSGKTTYGKALSSKLGMEFIDTDEYIEQREGMTISDIFKEKGEEYFRQLERDTLIYLRDNVKNTVFATGGGMPLRKENAMLLKEIGQVCYLTAGSLVIYERVKDSTNRPLLKCDDPYGKIRELMKERKPLYEEACDFSVDTDENDVEEILNRICKNVGR